MRTAIVSDLHLGTSFGEDLLRDPGVRATLIEEIGSADRVVLLGDAIELREQPLPGALAAARPFFEELGRALGGREVVIVPGNHDHRLTEPLLERATMEGRELSLQQGERPSQGPGARVAEWLGATGLTISYPGIWLRDDVYATHGHYMDCHMTLPRIECLAAATLMRMLGPVPDPAAPNDYEQLLRPIYGFSFGLAQSELAQRAHRPSERAWQTISGRNRPRGRIRRAAVRAGVRQGIPAGLWGLNRLLRTDFDPDLSASSISRSGIDAATELVRRLGLDAAHVITGHTHRAGPREGEPDWELPGGGRLHNSGSWIFASAFHHPGTPPGPYWPGTVTWLEDEGPPRRVGLLEERPREELQGMVDRARLRA